MLKSKRILSHNFHIYRSSAGSGKTYTLALSFIALALKGDRFGYENYYRKILAITFTNKAASEMKERVLEYLYLLSKEKDIDGILEWLKKRTSLDEYSIFSRSEIIHKHILHNYADLSISTIDKFTYKIVRTFASDLGLSNNFELEMNNYNIIQPAVALLLSKVSDKGGSLSKALVNFAIEKAEDGKSSNIELDLEEFAQQLFKEELANYNNGKILPVQSCILVKKDLQKNKHDLILKIKDLSNKVCLFFNNNGLTKHHFKRGTFYNYFMKNLYNDDDSKWRPSTSLLQNVTNNDWYSKTANQELKTLVDDLKSQLLDFFNEMLVLLIEYYSVKAVLKNIYSIAVLNELMKEVKEFKKENNIEQISEFNKKIHDIVINQPSTFIYERLGERYNHYLIDEFQDTSLLQWQNILPLVTDSLDIGKSMLVGDGKQSIYRWRGGEVEQFSKLPKIFKGKHLPFQHEWQQKLENHYFEDNLPSNYRSRKNIIEFNNLFFENTKELLIDELRPIYDKLKQSTNESKDGGYVYVNVFGDKEKDFKALILQKIVAEINKIISKNNYSYNNIAILCNSRKTVNFVAEKLSENGIPVISNEGLLLRTSEKVHTIIAILGYLQNETDEISKVVIAEYLCRYGLINENIHQIHLKIKSSEGFISVLERAQIYINPSLLLQEPLYELVEQIIRLFNFKQDIYLDFFLDLILSFSEKKGSSITDFLDWWENSSDKEAVVMPEGANAVQIMTIHKSKGLAFDVVMIPFNWEDRKRTSDIWVDTSKYFNKQLPLALIGGGSQLELSFFKNEYQIEKEMSLLDSLNKLYVAMTRAKDRLYILSKYLPNNLKNYERKGNLNSFLFKFHNSFPFTSGNSEMMYESNKDVKNIFKITNRKKVDWKELISLKHTAEEIWDTETAKTKRDWGKLLHLVLSKISYYNQKDDVIDKMYKLGDFTNEDYQKLKHDVTYLLNHDEIKPFFTNDWEVKNEQEILMSNGKTYIPDRLLFSRVNDKVVVIDYKTGVELENHKHQITDYANALMLMGKSDVDRVLIYTSENIKVIRL